MLERIFCNSAVALLCPSDTIAPISTICAIVLAGRFLGYRRRSSASRKDFVAGHGCWIKGADIGKCVLPLWRDMRPFYEDQGPPVRLWRLWQSQQPVQDLWSIRNDRWHDSGGAMIGGPLNSLIPFSQALLNKTPPPPLT